MSRLEAIVDYLNKVHTTEKVPGQKHPVKVEWYVSEIDVPASVLPEPKEGRPVPSGGGVIKG